jgi:hypothetical protein
MIKKSNYLIRYSTLIIVKGYLRNVLFDLVRNKYDFISHEMFDFFKKYQNRKLVGLSAAEKILLKEIIDKDWAFFSTQQEVSFFPKLSTEWHDNIYVQNAVIFYEGKEDILNLALSTLSSPTGFCSYYTIIITSDVKKETIARMLSILKKFSSIKVEIFIKYGDWINKFNDNRFEIIQIHLVTIFKAPIQIQRRRVVHVAQDLEFDFIDYNYFNPNINTYIESLRYNLFYHKKVIISESGYFVKSLVDKNPILKLTKQNLPKVLNLLSKINKWDISKDKIDVCKICEFRNMCLDSCEIIERNNRSYFRKKECNYNPYIAKWDNEINYKKLVDCGVSVTTEKFKMNKLKLLQTINSIYV